MKENDILESYVNDIEEATTAAYAEKAFRDLGIKYKNELSDIEKINLVEVAEISGEEALQAFRRKKLGLPDDKSVPKYHPYEMNIILKKALNEDF